MRKYILGIAALATMISGCSNDDNIAAEENNGGIVTELGATLGTTRTTLGEGGKVLWSVGDAVAAWNEGASSVYEYTLFEGAGTGTAKFRTANEKEGVNADADVYAFYPYSMVTGIGQVELPATQNYQSAANFSTNTNPAAAVGSDRKNLAFQNLCGVVSIKLNAAEAGRIVVNSIVLQSYSQALAGTATLTNEGGNLSLNCSGTSTLTLNCNVVLTTTNTEFYMVVPAGTYNGLDVLINTTDRVTGAVAVKKVSSSVFNISAGKITNIGAEWTLSNKTYAVGELYDNGKGMKGIVFQVDETGRSGKIVALTDANSGATMLWGPTASPLGVINMANGMANMEVVVNAGQLDAYPAFKAAREYDVTGKWYLPAHDELEVINNMWPALENVTAEGWTMLKEEAYWSSTNYGRKASIYYLGADGEFASDLPASQTAKLVRAVAAF